MKRHFFNLIYLLVLSSFFIVNKNYGITVGSDSAVSREALVVFPAADIDNEIRGFASMESGFALEDNTTTCTFDAALPVSGDVSLNGGLLYFKRDLIFSNATTFTSLGDVDANGFSLVLANSMTTIGTDTDSLFTFEDTIVELNSDINFQAKIRFDGNGVINGHGNVLDLASTASLVVGTNATLTLKYITVKGVNSTKIHCIDDTGVILLENVLLVQDGDFTFSKGALQFKTSVEICGEKKFIYTSSQTSTVLSDTKLELDYNHTFSYDPTSSADLFEFTDQTSILSLDGATLHAGEVGLQLKKGKLLVKNDSTISSETSAGIIFGNSVSSDDFAGVLLHNIKLTLQGGSLLYKNVNSASWQAVANRSMLTVATGATLDLYENINTDAGFIKFENNATYGRKTGKNITGSIMPRGTLLYDLIPFS